MEEGLADVGCRAGVRSWEGKPLDADVSGPPVQALGPPTTCRQSTPLAAWGSRLCRKRLVPPRQFARRSCLPTPILCEVRNKAVWFAKPADRDKWEPGFLRRN